MFKKMSFVIASAALLGACSSSNDYTPAAGASALDMHNAACASCHAPIEGSERTYFWLLAAEDANAEYIKAKISDGSMRMPGFPNIKGEQLDALVQFVLDNQLEK